MADVEIVVEAVDNASDEFKALVDSMEGLTKEIDDAVKSSDTFKKKQKETEDATKSLGGKLNATIKELTGFNVAQIGTAAAIGMTVKAVQAAIGDYSDYVEQIDKMSMATGLASEEMSRIAQVADDFRVNAGALENALKMALQNGFNPSVESLAELADRIKGIHDPAKKAEELSRIFGRSWQDMLPFLDRGGAAIRAAADGIGEGLIVTEKAIETNRKYQESVDNLGDSWTAFKYQLVGDVLPAIADALDKQSAAIDTYGKGYSKFLVEAMARSAQATKDWNSDTREAAFAAKYATTANEEYASSDHEIAMALQFMGQAARKAASDLDASTKSMERQAEAQRNIADATLALKDAQQNWMDGAGSDVQRALEESGVKGEAYDLALQGIDDTLGTTLATQNQYSKDLQAITDEYAKTGDVDKFNKKVGELKDTYMKTDESIQAATDSLWRFKLMWDTLQSKSLTLDVNIPGVPSASEGDIGLGGGDTVVVPDTDSGRGSGDDRFAAGGNARAGRTIMVGEFGPELFRPDVGGTITPTNSTLQKPEGDSVSYGPIYIHVMSNDPRGAAREIESVLGDQARIAALSGTQYQGA